MGYQPHSVCCSKHAPMPISDASVVNAMVEFGSGWANVADADREHFAALNAVCISDVQFNCVFSWVPLTASYSGFNSAAPLGRNLR